MDACARLADHPARCPYVRILASSREALGIGGEVTYRVPPWACRISAICPPSNRWASMKRVQLFIDRATRGRPILYRDEENAPAVAQVCHRLDGIPLAIELAAAKVRVLSVEQIAKRLDDRFRLLTGGSRTALERHQTLRAAIDWSYNLLPAAEQVLFRRLSVFVGGWTWKRPSRSCGDGMEEDIFDLLEQLVNKSLVMLRRGQETRYRMLETIRQYASEKLLDAGGSKDPRISTWLIL